MEKKNIMVVGHVDHGNTTLASAIANQNEVHVVKGNDDLRKNNETENDDIANVVGEMMKDYKENIIGLTDFNEDIFVENPRLKRRAKNRKENNGIKPKYMGKPNPFKKK